LRKTKAYNQNAYIENFLGGFVHI